MTIEIRLRGFNQEVLKTLGGKVALFHLGCNFTKDQLGVEISDSGGLAARIRELQISQIECK